ncbi:MAG: adenylate kinase [Enterococcus sp.]
MIIIISGATHTGKTALAQKILERAHFPYLSQDHLKMGLIRAEETQLTPEDDGQLTPYLWKITKEIIKTALENKQNLIVEGCYIPFDWQASFSAGDLAEIKFICLVLSKKYIEQSFAEIKMHANVMEQRLDDSDCTKEFLIAENTRYLKGCQSAQLDYHLVAKRYDVGDYLNEFIR